jgi:hypothetical protein
MGTAGGGLCERGQEYFSRDSWARTWRGKARHYPAKHADVASIDEGVLMGFAGLQLCAAPRTPAAPKPDVLRTQQIREQFRSQIDDRPRKVARIASLGVAATGKRFARSVSMTKTSKTKSFEKLKDPEKYLVAGPGGATHQIADAAQGSLTTNQGVVVAITSESRSASFTRADRGRTATLR